MKLAGYTDESIVDGPGVRCVIFFQGCRHHCPFCQNPQTWSFDAGTEVSIDDIDRAFEKIKDTTSGVTLSGGDPFCSLDDSIEVARLAKEKYGFNLLAFTGYTLEELLKLAKDDGRYMTLLSLLDILIDGRFIMALRSIFINNRGSRNQRCIDVQKTLKDGKIHLVESMMDMSFYEFERPEF